MYFTNITNYCYGKNICLSLRNLCNNRQISTYHLRCVCGIPDGCCAIGFKSYNLRIVFFCGQRKYLLLSAYSVVSAVYLKVARIRLYFGVRATIVAERERCVVPKCLVVAVVPKCLVVATVPKCLAVATVPKCLVIATVPKCLASTTVPKCLVVAFVPKCLVVAVVPKCLAVATVPKCLVVAVVPKCLVVAFVPKCLVVAVVPKCLASTVVPKCLVIATVPKCLVIATVPKCYAIAVISEYARVCAVSCVIPAIVFLVIYALCQTTNKSDVIKRHSSCIIYIVYKASPI